jgi:hypothetical protein
MRLYHKLPFRRRVEMQREQNQEPSKGKKEPKQRTRMCDMTELQFVGSGK